MKPQICLGTAQFGFDYGITNAEGKVKIQEVEKIINHCNSSGIRLIDSAQSYGESELVLGNTIPSGKGFKIISKLKPQDKNEFSLNDISHWEEDLIKSLGLLKSNTIEGLLLHQPLDLLKPGAIYLKDWLLNLKKRGIVKRIGISIYKPKDLLAIDKEIIDIVQLPLSLYDQRLLQDGTIKNLLTEGYSIFARSIYLQGLLLRSSKEWPSWIKESTKAHHRKLEKYAEEQGFKLIDVALGFIRSQQMLEAVIVGVCNLRELKELLKSWNTRNEFHLTNWDRWALDDIKAISPQTWPI